MYGSNPPGWVSVIDRSALGHFLQALENKVVTGQKEGANKVAPLRLLEPAVQHFG